MEIKKYECKECLDTGIVTDKLNKQFHTCWACLNKHKLDQDKKDGK
jgi:hypothetical protein